MALESLQTVRVVDLAKVQHATNGYKALQNKGRWRSKLARETRSRLRRRRRIYCPGR